MRAVVYARVSTDEQAEEGFSIQAQTRMCHDWIKTHSHIAVGEYIEEGKSGGSITKRERLQELIEGAKQKQFEIVVIHKLDRFSRNLKDTLNIMSTFEANGVTLVSVTESFDFSTPVGRMVLTLLVSFAQFFLDNLSNEVRKGNIEKVRQGYWHGKIAPPGYRLVDGKLVIYEEEAKSVHRAFELYALDHLTVLELADQLLSEGLGKNVDGKVVRYRWNTLTRILHNRIYVGDIEISANRNEHKKRNRDRKWMRYPGKHTPIVDVILFNKVQAILNVRGTAGRGVHANISTHIYGRGLLHCSDCGSILHGSIAVSHKPHSFRYMSYRCKTHMDGLPCSAQHFSISETKINGAFQAVIEHFNMPGVIHEGILAGMQNGGQMDVYAEQREKLLHKRERLSKLYLNDRIPEDDYWKEDKRIDKELNALPDSPIGASDVGQAMEVVVSLPAVWEKANSEERRDLVHLMFRGIVVDLSTGKIVSFKPMPAFILLFTDVDENGMVTLHV